VSSSGSGEQRDKRAVPAEQHLGDRLAAFVDGELTDDSRDRVLAHLVTCPQCKAAATEQRRLKSVVAGSGLPAISAGLMARLQGLPAGGCDSRDDEPPGPWADDAGLGGSAGERRGPFDGGLLGSGVFGSGRREEFSYLAPARDLASSGSRGRGFRIHERSAQIQERVAQEADRAAAAAAAVSGAAAASRSRRFAFAAAGAFSMAAIAIGGALPMEAAVDGGARPDDGPAVSPFSANSVADTHGATPRDLLDAGSTSSPGATSVSVTRPLSGTPGSSVQVLAPADSYRLARR
jgi:hypothetical protein